MSRIIQERVPSAHSTREIEIKLRVTGAAAARRILKAAGFRVLRPRVLEKNWVLDTPDLKLRQGRSLLRVRQAGRRAALTYKHSTLRSKYKSLEELEIEISDASVIHSILERLGFRCVFRYEKHRTEYAQPGTRGIVTLDETPIGCYLEVEGAPRWIDRTARALGFGESDYINTSYGTLYQEFCEARGVKPADMVFQR
jgi:adenylate cyclase class 2